MKRVILRGTTTGTMWQQEFIGDLLRAGVRGEQIFYPHLSHGVRYTDEHKKREIAYKNDPETLIVVYICPAIIPPGETDPIDRAIRTERIDAIAIYEAARYAYSAPQRTAVVFDYKKFTAHGPSYRILEDLTNELFDTFNGQPPYFPGLNAVKRWVISQLT
jgi:hypothetical protein